MGPFRNYIPAHKETTFLPHLQIKRNRKDIPILAVEKKRCRSQNKCPGVGGRLQDATQVTQARKFLLNVEFEY